MGTSRGEAGLLYLVCFELASQLILPLPMNKGAEGSQDSPYLKQQQ